MFNVELHRSLNVVHRLNLNLDLDLDSKATVTPLGLDAEMIAQAVWEDVPDQDTAFAATTEHGAQLSELQDKLVEKQAIIEGLQLDLERNSQVDQFRSNLEFGRSHFARVHMHTRTHTHKRLLQHTGGQDMWQGDYGASSTERRT